MTAQVPETVFYRGEALQMFSYPLDSYYQLSPPAPPFVIKSSANWRGYVASWEISDKRLYMIGLTGSVCVRQPNPQCSPTPECPVGHLGRCITKDVELRDLFGKATVRLSADWFSGDLLIGGRPNRTQPFGVVEAGDEGHLTVSVVDGRIIRIVDNGWRSTGR